LENQERGRFNLLLPEMPGALAVGTAVELFNAQEMKLLEN
jgi:hypothetical protein